MRYVALICARGGSKGLPGKNIRLLNGKPLIGWAIDIAKKIKQIGRIIVSTDSQEIAEIAVKEGAEVPFMRPKEIAQDNSPEWLVWRHAIKYLNQSENEVIDGLIIIPVTAPLRARQDIENCLEAYEKNGADIIITVSDAHRSPYFNMVTNDKNGYSSLVIAPERPITRRQDSPEVYDMTTVAYVVRPEFVMQKNGIFDGKVRSVYVPQERALDIDTAFDFQVAECLLNNKIGMEMD